MAEDKNNPYVKDAFTYANLLDARRRFRTVKANGDFQRYDQPGTYYFKLFFYFNSPDVNDDDYALACNLLGVDGSPSTALNFLKRNGEDQRAEYLKKFVYLLSEINSSSPWYFQSIEGLDDALDRGYYKDSFKISEEPKSITIKCLQDAIDNRISTLLELYFSACFSHIDKKVIVPINLRRFDMGIYIFQSPYAEKPDPVSHTYKYEGDDKEYRALESKIINDIKITSHKYIELHDCEISPSSYKTIIGNPDNKAGFSIEPSITIDYNTSVIYNYNSELCMFIGDLIKTDISNLNDAATVDTINKNTQDTLNKEIDYHYINTLYDGKLPTTRVEGYPTPETPGGLWDDIKDYGVSRLTRVAKGVANRLLLGNVYSFSFNRMVNNLHGLGSNPIGSTIATIDQVLTSNVPGFMNSIASEAEEAGERFLGNVNEIINNGVVNYVADRVIPEDPRERSLVGKNVYASEAAIRRNL